MMALHAQQNIDKKNLVKRVCSRSITLETNWTFFKIMRWIQKKSQSKSSGVMIISQRSWKAWYANRWGKNPVWPNFPTTKLRIAKTSVEMKTRKENHVQPCQRIWSLPVKQPETNSLASLLVTFLGWLNDLNDPLKGDSWPPNRESKGHFESLGLVVFQWSRL